MFARITPLRSLRGRLLSQGRRAPAIPLRVGAAAFMAAAAAIPADATVAQAAGTPAFTPATGTTRMVTNRSDAGPGSLRAAIMLADASPPGRSTVIDFAVAGTIALTRALPVISRGVTIDGTSAPSYSSGGPPVVEIDCNGRVGLRFVPGSAGSQLLGVAVDNAGGNGVTLAANRITLNHNYIGLNLSGAPFGNQGNGVYVSAFSSRNFIGLNSSGASGAVANVISANLGSGIVLAGSSGNTVVSNRIGTNPAGTVAVPNGGDGIYLTRRSDGNQIGGTEYVDSATGKANNPTGDKGTVPPVFVVPPLGNLISGNGRNGVKIDVGSRNNVLNGNFIGTTANGDAAIGNAGNGVWIDRADDNALVGCKFVNNPFVYYNVVSGNGLNGLRVTNSSNTVIQGNFFGIGANNTAIVSNRLDGVKVDGSSANTEVGGVIPLGNVSAGNGRNGIEVAGTASGFTTFNTFGGLLAFKGAAPNGGDGLLITSSGSGNLVRTNVFSGNDRAGIDLAGNANGVTVDPNIVGLTTNGRAVLPNGADGVLIRGDAHGNIIGGTLRSVIPQNTFAGNAHFGLAIIGRAHGNLVFNTFIGTKIFGLAAAANHWGGVFIGGLAHGNQIGFGPAMPSNLISGNMNNGLTLGSHTRWNVVVSNYIGLDRLGRWLRNTGRPLVNNGTHNIIVHNRFRP